MNLRLHLEAKEIILRGVIKYMETWELIWKYTTISNKNPVVAQIKLTCMNDEHYFFSVLRKYLDLFSLKLEIEYGLAFSLVPSFFAEEVTKLCIDN